MGTGLIAAGMLFLFNPFVNIVDVLPDFIGYILIFAGLAKLAFLDERLRNARRGVSIMLLLSVIKTALLPLLPSMDSTMVLLLTFAFFTVESIFAIPAFRDLFGGFVGLGELYGLKSTFYPRRRRIPASERRRRGIKHNSGSAYVQKDGINGLIVLTNVFFILRGGVCCLPEITALQSPDSGRLDSWDSFNPLLRGAAVILMLPLAIIWAVSVFRYFRGIDKDKDFICTVEKRYNDEILPRDGMLCGVHMKNVMMLYVVACLSAGALYIDYVNVVPVFLSAAFFAAVVIMLRGYIKTSRERVLSICAVSLCALRAVSGVCSYIFQSSYAAEYKPEHFFHVSGARLGYIPVMIFSAADGIFGCAAVICIVLLLRSIYIRQTGYLSAKKSGGIGSVSRAAEAIRLSRLPFVLSASLTAVSAIVFGLHPAASLYIEPWMLIEWVLFAADICAAVYLEDRTSALLYKDLAEFE